MKMVLVLSVLLVATACDGGSLTRATARPTPPTASPPQPTTVAFDPASLRPSPAQLTVTTWDFERYALFEKFMSNYAGASWYGSIRDVSVTENRAMVRSYLDSGADPSALAMCNAAANFVFDPGNAGLGLSRVDILNSTGQQQLMFKRESILQPCMVARR